MTRIHQPEFLLFPIHNARTAYQRVALPTVLMVPWVRNKNGIGINSSQVFDVCFKIEDSPGKVPVAGYEYKGIFVPDFERFVLNLDLSDLVRYRLNLGNYIILDGVTKEEKEYADIVNGDIVSLTLSSGIKGELVYYSDAEYYDLSMISLETYDLMPLGNYIFSWHASYYRRVISPNDEFNCIDTSFTGLARLPIEFAHPGDVHQAMIELSPSIYFDGSRLDQDKTVKFYRALADIMQDIFDEAELLPKLNSINEIPAAYIPYLAYLLGWDLPYFPGSTDEMRRRILANARRLQELKGSKLAVIDLFEAFGFIINLINLWSTTDGKKLVGPNEQLPDQYSGQEISGTFVCRADPLISDWTNATLPSNEKEGFGNITVPLLYRPYREEITIEAWVLNTSSDVYTSLVNATDDYASLESDLCAVDSEGYLTCPAFHAVLNTGSIIGYSQVLINSRGVKIDRTIGQPPISKYGITYDSYWNTLNINFGRYLDLKENERLFVFATYRATKIEIPAELQNLRTNKFDLIILERPDGSEASPDVLKFLIDFVFRLKAFHSLLRKIIYTTTNTSVYNVGDMCVGGDIQQRAGTGIGEMQVPPPIDPGIVNDIECADKDATSRFKKSDIDIRNTILDGLENEFVGWKRLDGTHSIPSGFEDTHNAISVLSLSQPTLDSCQFTEKGQDKKFDNTSLDLDHDADTRETACSTANSNNDYCYKGRVVQEAEVTRVLGASEMFRFKACNLGLGAGSYFTDSSGNIRYTNRDDNDVGSMLLRPGLDIQKDNLGIPGHRLPLIGQLMSDFTHTIWSARPWDDLYNPLCPATTVPAELDFRLELDDDGNEVMVFNDVELIYYGNGLTPDISGLSDHSNTDGKLVTHKIYSTASAGHEAITFDQITFIDPSAATEIAVTAELENIFNSASEG